MIENRISGYLHNELFSIVYKSTIKNRSTALQAFSFRSLSLCIFYFLFLKAGILLQFLSEAFSIFYTFSPISVFFHKCFNNFS